MNNVNINVSFNLNNPSDKETFNKVLQVLEGKEIAASLPEIADATSSVATQLQTSTKGGNNTQKIERERKIKELINILSSFKTRGAFIYTDLCENRDKYGITASKSALYSYINELEEKGLAKKCHLYNENSKATNKIQEYVQLL